MNNDDEPIGGSLLSDGQCEARSVRLRATALLYQWECAGQINSYEMLRKFCGVPELTDSAWTDTGKFTHGHLRKIQTLLGPNGYTLWKAWKAQHEE